MDQNSSSGESADELQITDHQVHKLSDRNSNNNKKAQISDDAEYIDNVDTLYDFYTIEKNSNVTGFLLTLHPNFIVSEKDKPKSCVDLYFIGEGHKKFKLSLVYQPYLYVIPAQDATKEVANYLSKRFSDKLSSTDVVLKEDLTLPNHLAGHRLKCIKLSFWNTDDLQAVKRDLVKIVTMNQSKPESSKRTTSPPKSTHSILEYSNDVLDIREHDVSYHSRFCIDKGVFAAKWYDIKYTDNFSFEIVLREDLVERPQLNALAFDIETTKLPLKFPDKEIDQIMMISYMINQDGYLITNRELISEDIDDFEFTPKPEYQGSFKIFNEPDEEALLRKFFSHILDVKPEIFTTYNGDYFDWPFVEARAAVYQINMKNEIGFYQSSEESYLCRCCIHLDCIYWVKRDSYLPFGSHGLKAVAKAKLGYNPIEISPEDMCKFAVEEPITLANYSVSDAVATYYLFKKYVFPFNLSLSSIIPMTPDELLRKGTGTCCEHLLMDQAFKANVIYPNKTRAKEETFTEDGKLLLSETYAGGHVEAIECGVFRSNINYKFNIDSKFVTSLKEDVRNIFETALVKEMKIKLEDIKNLDECIDEVNSKLQKLADEPKINENPLIYHLDVGAMYPNIMLTHRLQPTAMVNDSICAQCDFNKPSSNCKRPLEWKWRGEICPTTKAEISSIRLNLSKEKFRNKNGEFTPFSCLPFDQQKTIEQQRIKDYSKKMYKKFHFHRNDVVTTTVCQRENSFYIDTIRLFRDRRYEFKALLKKSNRNLAEAIKSGASREEIHKLSNLVVIYDSLQVAHKCILNSFYGYVMRKGSRWFSMETGGIVCYTGSQIIQQAKYIVDAIGRPLEIDTDGIWCMIPCSFPDTVTIELKNGSKVPFNFPNSMLNHMVASKFSNEQYQVLVDKKNFKYDIQVENSIFFEVDGPYLSMILPSAKEEGKKLKKRYAVFNKDESLQELKGFEVKRRGELQIIKSFQSDVFKMFLRGTTLEEAYQSAASVANYWLDILDNRGEGIDEDEIIELISENKNMAKTLSEYGPQKSTTITTAKRLEEVLGPEMTKSAGLQCKFIISKDPADMPVTQRAVPVVVLMMEESVKLKHLEKWLGINLHDNFDLRSIIDWSYYRERLANTIKKIITYPAAFQHVTNPCPRILHDEWVKKMVKRQNNTIKQSKLTGFVTKYTPSADVAKNSPGKKIQSDLSSNDKENCVPVQPQAKKAKSSDLKSFIVKSGDVFLRNVSELIKIEHIPSSEYYYLWFLVDNKIRKVQMKIPKIFFVAVLKDEELSTEIFAEFRSHFEGKISISKVAKTLPYSMACSNIFRISMDFNMYQENHLFIDDYFKKVDFGILFEDKLSTIQKFILYKGIFCKFTKKDPKSKWESKDLISVDQSKVEYGDYAAAFNYFICMETPQCTMILFYCQTKKQILLKFITKNKIDKSFLQTFRNIFENSNRLQNFSSGFDLDQMDLKLGNYETIEAALKSVDSEINSSCRQKDKSQNYLTIFETNIGDLESISKHFSKSQDSSPLIFLHRPELVGLNILNWQVLTTTLIVRRFLDFKKNFNAHLSKSRFLSVPIGNMEDLTLFDSMDILIAREMVEKNILVDFECKGFDIHQVVPERKFKKIEISNAKFYRTQSCFFRLQALTINAIIQCTNLFEEAEFDVYNIYKNDDLESEVSDESNPLTSSHFLHFRSVILKLLNLCIDFESQEASRILHTIDKWLYAKNANTSNILLRHCIEIILSLQFETISKSLSQLPIEVVYFDSQSLIISMKRKLSQDEKGKEIYDSFVSHLKSQKTLKGIQFHQSRIFEHLIWINKSNYAAIVLDSKTSVPKLFSSLRISNFLPQNTFVQEKFSAIIGGYLMKTYKKFKQEWSNFYDGLTPINVDPNTETISDPLMLPSIKKHSQNVIKFEVSPIFFKVCDEILNHISSQTLQMPLHMPAHLKQVNVGATFIASLTRILTLDPSIVNEVESIESGCYSLLNLSSFAFDLSFQSFSFCPAPTQIFLNNINCTKCNNYVTVDISSDLFLSEQSQFELLCPFFSCRAPLQIQDFERSLHQTAKKLIQHILKSPLKCHGCKTIVPSRHSSSCKSCLQPLVSTEEVEMSLKQLEIIKDLSLSAKYSNISQLIAIYL